MVQPNYNPLEQQMSELALGRFGSFMFLAFSSFALFLLISGAIGFGVAYESVGKTTDVDIIERYWVDNFRDRLYELFVVPTNTFSTGAELIDLLQRNVIDNPITGEPIIIEHSPGNMIVEKAGDKILMKICLENGSLYTLF